MQIGTGELQAKHERFGSARNQERESRDDIADSDFLVIDGRDPAGETGLRFPDLFQSILQACGRILADGGSAFVIGNAHRRSLS
jgi:hypothetical protein